MYFCLFETCRSTRVTYNITTSKFYIFSDVFSLKKRSALVKRTRLAVVITALSF